jgi:hypothetical protein
MICSVFIIGANIVLTILGFKVENEKIILTSLNNETDEKIDLELPKDIYARIITDGPPSSEKVSRSIRDEINRIRLQRVMTIEKLDKDLEALDDEEEGIREQLLEATEKNKITALSAVLSSIAGQRANLGQRRHLVRLLYQEQGKLELELMNISKH